MKRVVIDGRASEKTKAALEKMGFDVVGTPRLNSVYNAICGHADILMHKTEDMVIAEPCVYDFFRKSLVNTPVIKGETVLKCEYPFDIAYNCARVGKRIICREKHTDGAILAHYRERDYDIIDTRQGYAKCNVCTVSDNAIITSDKNIARRAEKNGISVLEVNDGAVALDGFEHGFFGGATGLLDVNTLAVNGDINFHTDMCRIVDFCRLFGVRIVSLSDEPITDIGSIIVC